MSSILGGNSTFCYIYRRYQWEGLYKILGGRAKFLLELQAVRIIKGFPVFLEIGLFFITNFAGIF